MEKQDNAEQRRQLTVATIFSYAANEEDPDDILGEEGFDTEALDQTSRDFLEGVIKDYNETFHTNFDTSADKFQNYYKDLSMRVKNREVDLLIVVNMFLTGFDATTLNTLWVDKNLKMHGLLQAYSRTNRILNSVKTYGNIICFRDLQQATDDALALFGDENAGGIVLLKSFEDYYHGFEDAGGRYHPGYIELLERLDSDFPLGQEIIGERAEKEFIKLFSAILSLRNILASFDKFGDVENMPERDLQDYQSIYIDLYDKYWNRDAGDKENINDDIVFEIELIKQVEVNIDYILMLVEKYHDGNCENKEILATIQKAVDASLHRVKQCRVTELHFLIGNIFNHKLRSINGHYISDLVIRLFRFGFLRLLLLFKYSLYLFLCQFPVFQLPPQFPALFLRSHKKHITGDCPCVPYILVCL